MATNDRGKIAAQIGLRLLDDMVAAQAEIVALREALTALLEATDDALDGYDEFRAPISFWQEMAALKDAAAAARLLLDGPP